MYNLTIPTRKERSEGIFFIRPGSRLVQQQGRTDVAEVITLDQSWNEKEVSVLSRFDSSLHRWFSTVPCWSTMAMLLPWLSVGRIPSSQAVETGQLKMWLMMVIIITWRCSGHKTSWWRLWSFFILGQSISTSLPGGKNQNSKNGNHICDKVCAEKLHKYRHRPENPQNPI